MIRFELDHEVIKGITCENREDVMVLRDVGFGWSANGHAEPAASAASAASAAAPEQLANGSATATLEAPKNYGRPGSKAYIIRDFMNQFPDIETPKEISREMRRLKVMKVTPADVSGVITQLKRRPR